MYRIDFKNMIQINIKTQEKRKILRKVHFRRLLSKNSPNYKEAAEYFHNSLGANADHYQIDSIEMILNPTLWQLYCVYLNGLQTKTPDPLINSNGTSSNNVTTVFSQSFERRWLFHGTKTDRVPKIIQNGFNRSFNECSHYGRGCYFARHAIQACNKRYSCPEPITGNRYIFLCRVAVGYYCKGHHSKALIPPTKRHDPSETFDTTVDTIENPSVFVTYHDAQAYPEYFISFKYSGYA